MDDTVGPPLRRPPEDGCDLWLLAEDDVEQVADLLHAYPSLSAPERARLDSLVRPGSRRRHLGARVLARFVLARYLPVQPDEIVFDTGPYGRPRVEQPQTMLDFNLTHTDGVIACAVAARPRIGLDAETYPAAAHTARLVSKVMTPYERRLTDGRSLSEITAVLAEHWVLKEAYTKALGLGLHHPFESFDLHDIHGSPRVHDPAGSDSPAAWSMHLLHVDPGHVLAVAADSCGPDRSFPIRQIDAARELAGVHGRSAELVPRRRRGAGMGTGLSGCGQSELRHRRAVVAGSAGN